MNTTFCHPDPLVNDMQTPGLFPPTQNGFALVAGLFAAALASPRWVAVLRYWLVTVLLDPFASAGTTAAFPPQPIPVALMRSWRWGRRHSSEEAPSLLALARATLRVLRKDWQPAQGSWALVYFWYAGVVAYVLWGRLPGELTGVVVAVANLCLRVYRFCFVVCNVSRVAFLLFKVLLPATIVWARRVGPQLARQARDYLVRHWAYYFSTLAVLIVALLLSVTPLDSAFWGACRQVLLPVAEGFYLVGDVLRDAAWWCAKRYYYYY